MTETIEEGRREAASGVQVRPFHIADVRGYTRFTVERGEGAAARFASSFADVADATITAQGGRLVELRGDEALAVFSSVRGALRAAVELQAA